MSDLKTAELNYSDWFQAKIKTIRETSGDVTTWDPLIHFLYILMRDYITVGVAEKILEDMEWEQAQGKKAYSFTNGWLAKYALNIADRLWAVAQANYKFLEEIKCQTSNTTKDSLESGKRTPRSTSKKSKGSPGSTTSF